MSVDALPTQTPLTYNQKTLINFLEEWWFSHDDLNQKFPSQQMIVSRTKLPTAEVTRYLKDKKVLAALDSRGIIYADITLLLPEQLAVANVILDFSDRRSQKVKLNDLGISTTKYSAWLRQPKFQRYLRYRAESLLGNTQHEAHTALLKNVQNGDLNSIKLYYEVTGRWSSKPAAELNLEFILLKVVESVQKYVTDPAAITAIARELGELLPNPSTPELPPVEEVISESAPTSNDSGPSLDFG